ncbi:MAG TPA: bifunctional diaminohydroxyphosphoribosylaminopyrimidine deaminase/5-amino-6-(5-phosphoribosylamino)uracil reductase RibD [Tepidisphaeraceae bacterium]|jgi:diaminohydroxyphosphoribosylaminopyrimidine deaminase/5-amino-6-(5-phosphoribosylamino)uracil reductase
MDSDDVMRRALELAMRGRGRVEPNPMVGCVIVKDGQVIGEGYHEKFRGPHAEANALAACGDAAAGATAIVSLEPCGAFENKKTPPCAGAMIAARIARVIAACEDPNPLVAGHGLAELREAGVGVEVGILGASAKQLNAAYFKRVLHRRPYVTLKWAQTADGKIAGPGGQRMKISNAASFRVIHDLRGRCDAILVGLATVLADDPLLMARGINPQRPLVRVVLDCHLRIPMSSQLIRTAAQSPVLVCCEESAFERNAGAVARLRGSGVEVAPLRGEGRISLEHLLDDLGARGITHLLVEPGAKLARSFLGQGLTDRVWVFHSPLRVNSEDAPDAMRVIYPTTGIVELDGDELHEHLNPGSDVFFAMERSPDLLMAEGDGL